MALSKTLLFISTKDSGRFISVAFLNISPWFPQSVIIPSSIFISLKGMCDSSLNDLCTWIRSLSPYDEWKMFNVFRFGHSKNVFGPILSSSEFMSMDFKYFDPAKA